MKRSEREARRRRVFMVTAGIAALGALVATNGLAHGTGDAAYTKSHAAGILVASDDDARQPQSGLYDDRGLGEDHGPGNDYGPGEDHGPGNDYGPGEEHGPGNDYGPGEEHGPGEDYGPTSIGGTGSAGTTPGPTPRMPSSGIGGGASGGAGGSTGHRGN